jgi:uncharacterized membrane protein
MSADRMLQMRAERWRSMWMFGVGAIGVVTLCWGLIAWTLGRAHNAWCADQYKVARTHADTVTTTRLCGAP